jgi:hypothetical protein
MDVQSDENKHGSATPVRRAYLLRIWVEPSHEHNTPCVWRLSLEGVRTQARHGFRSVAELALFLQEELRRLENGTGDSR